MRRIIQRHGRLCLINMTMKKRMCIVQSRTEVSRGYRVIHPGGAPFPTPALLDTGYDLLSPAGPIHFHLSQRLWKLFPLQPRVSRKIHPRHLTRDRAVSFRKTVTAQYSSFPYIFSCYFNLLGPLKCRSRLPPQHLLFGEKQC